MMAGRQSRIDGVTSAAALFDQLPASAEEELLVEMGILGREILGAQKADVAKDTGALQGALSLQLVAEQLRMRIGLLRGGRDAGRRNGRAVKARAGGPFYGRIVEEGRSAQTVVVTRRVKKRRINGNGTESARTVTYLGASKRLRRRGPNKGSAIGSPYKLKVKAMKARPYVAQPLLVDAAQLHLADFWSHALTRTGRV